MTEQEHLVEEEMLTKEIITYIKTENDVAINVSQLAEDPRKLSIDNGRWVVDTRKKFAICLSKEFEEAVMSCTRHNVEEWVGFIVGNDVKWTNPENNRQMQILIAERVVILGQARTGASAEIKQDVVEKWMDSEDESSMAFRTVFAKNRWQKIGWVHSHADLGVFWSKTDTDTMEDMRGIPTLLSIVYAREGKDKVDRRVRVDKNDVLFGGKYNLYMDEIEDAFIISESCVEKLDDVSEEIQDYYKDVLAHTEILNTTSHSNATYKKPTTTTTYKSSYPQGSIMPGRTVQTTLTEQLSKHTIVHGEISEKTKEEIIKFGEFHYSLPDNGRSKVRNITIADFVVLLDETMADQMRPDGLYKKWKMKEIVDMLDEQQILNIIAFYKNSEIAVQLALKTYHNFKQFTDRLMWLLNLKLLKDLDLATRISDIAGKDWGTKVSEALIEKDSIQMDIGDVEKVVEELKPIPFMPSSEFTDWKDWYLMLPSKNKADFWDTLFNLGGDEERQVKLLDRIEDAVLFEIRGDEDKYLDYSAVVYQCFVEMWKKTSKKNKEAYHYFYTSYYMNAFKPYFLTTKYYNEKVPRLQKLLNALDEEYVKQFLNDFVCTYETEEELEEIVKKYPKDYPVYKQTFRCPLCGIVWLNKKDSESCEDECRKRGRSITKTVKEIEAKSTTKKEKVSTQSILELQNVSDGWTIMDEDTQLIASNGVFGTSVKYYEGLNVCGLCGSLYDTQEGAEICLEQCLDLLEDVKEYFIELYGWYRCSFCGEEFTDVDEALLHDNNCDEYGAILDYVVYLVTSVDLVPADSIALINSHYTSKGGIPAPFIEWLILKGEKNDSLFVCSVCGAENVPSNLSMKNRLLRAYAHENYCMYEEKNDLVEWNGEAFVCKVCTNYVFSTTYAGTMTSHLYYKHGMYPTAEQLDKFTNKDVTKLDVVDVVVGVTQNTVLLEDGFVCKQCGWMYHEPETLINHISTTHGVVPTDEECHVLIAHDANIELMLSGELNSFKANETITVEQTVTKNVKAYNGIFVCSYCEVTVGNVDAMRKHLFEAHKINMNTVEENILKNYLKNHLENPKKDVVKAVDDFNADYLSENLQELFEAWLIKKREDQKPIVVCEVCAEIFLEGKDVNENAWNCFVHEVDCRNLSSFGISAFTCGICGIICLTVIERELCEEGHLSKSDMGNMGDMF